MTSNSSEYGNAFCDSEYYEVGTGKTNRAYFAFDNNTSTEWASGYSDGRDNYIGFKFNNPVCIKKAMIYNRMSTTGFNYAKLQASNDKSNWTELVAVQYNAGTKIYANINNKNNYSYYRFVIGGYSSNLNMPRATEIQFYGR